MKYRANAQDTFHTIGIKALDSMVIGATIDFAGKEEKIPVGWLICDGSAVSRTEYSELFDAIGTNWGIGDGNTTFNLPPAGIVRVGYDANDADFNAIGKTGGSKELQSHEHIIPLGNGGSIGAEGTNDRSARMRNCTLVDTTAFKTGSTGTGNSGNLQPYGTFYTLIKAKNTTPTMASVVNTTNNSTTDSYSCKYINEHESRYSNDEMKIGTFVDGKPIYKKTLHLTSGWNVGSETTLQHGLSNVDEMLKYEGFAFRTNHENQMIPSNFGSTTWVLSVFDMGKTSYKIYVGSGFTGQYFALTDIYITFYYTKTTD